MCYSKEVQLITSLIIFALTSINYWYWSHKFQRSGQRWLLPHLNNVVIAFFAIGGHQLFEFLSIITENQWIYKTGLSLSIFSMYFFLRAIEQFEETNIHSSIALIFIAPIIGFIFYTPSVFGPVSFYVEHRSSFFWASGWMALFIYAHIVTFMILKKYYKNESQKHIVLWGLLATLDFSFLLAFVYTLLGYSRWGLNVCYAAPSIWCTFFVVQVLVFPLFLHYHLKFKKPQHHTIKMKTAVTILGISAVIVASLALSLPFFGCLTWKFVFP